VLEDGYQKNSSLQIVVRNKYTVKLCSQPESNANSNTEHLREKQFIIIVDSEP